MKTKEDLFIAWEKDWHRFIIDGDNSWFDNAGTFSLEEFAKNVSELLSVEYDTFIDTNRIYPIWFAFDDTVIPAFILDDEIVIYVNHIHKTVSYGFIGDDIGCNENTFTDIYYDISSNYLNRDEYGDIIPICWCEYKDYPYSDIMDCYITDSYIYRFDNDDVITSDFAMYRDDIVYSEIQEKYFFVDDCVYLEDIQEYVSADYAESWCFQDFNGDWYESEPEPEENNIYSYHGYAGGYYPIKLNESDKSWFIGIELEVDHVHGIDSDSLAGHALSLFNGSGDLFHAEYDGSVDHEYISQPMTFEKWLSEKENVSLAFDYLKQHCTSHDAGTCGLHMHINNSAFKNDVQYLRFKLILEHFKSDLFKFSRRQNIDGYYYNFLTTGNTNKSDLPKKVKALKNGSVYGHTSWINEHSKRTFELRFYRGTLNIDTFYASLELTYKMIKYATDESIDLISWENLTSHCREYCEKRNCLNAEPLEINRIMKEGVE